MLLRRPRLGRISKVKIYKLNLKCFFSWNPVAEHSISIARQSSARQCWSVLAYSVSVSHPRMIIKWIEIWPLKYQRGIFKSKSQFNYLFTLKKCTFKFNEICRICGLNRPVYALSIWRKKSRDVEFFKGITFLLRPVYSYYEAYFSGVVVKPGSD